MPATARYRDVSLENLLAALDQIEMEFGVKFTFPSPMTNDFEDLVTFLVNGMREGEVIGKPRGPMTITLVPAAIASIDAMLSEGKDLTVEITHSIVLFGQELEPVTSRSTFVSPRMLGDTIENVRSALEAGRDVDVRFSFERVIHSFPRWQKVGASSE